MSIEHELGPFAIVPLWVMDELIAAKTPEAIRLYIALHRWAGAERRCWPSRKTIAEACGCSVDTVDRYKDALVAIGALRIESRVTDDGDRTSNVYTLLATGGSRTHAAGGSRTDAVTGSRVDAAQTKPSTEPERPTGAAGSEAEPTDAEDAPASEEATALCDEMADAIEAWGAKRPSVGKTWCRDMDRMVRIDGREPDEVRRVITWLYRSSDEVAVFWAPNVQCPAKLRAKWDVIAGQTRRQQAQGEPLADRIRRLAGAR